MKLPSPRIALALAALAPLGAFAQTAPAAAPYSFTLPAPAQRAFVAPATVPDLLPFQLTVNGVAPTSLTSVGVMLMGSVQPGNVATYELVYYPNGYASPGIVVGSTTGATFAQGPKSSIVTIKVNQPTPVTLTGATTASFSIKADLKGTSSYYVVPRLQTVTIDDGSGSQDLLNTELPVNGDVIVVN